MIGANDADPDTIMKRAQSAGGQSGKRRPRVAIR
jgi:hypothetical protein